MSKEMDFFIYLLERYSSHKNKTADEVLSLWDKMGLTDTIYNLYEMYHIERLENAFDDIDLLMKERASL